LVLHLIGVRPRIAAIVIYYHVVAGEHRKRFASQMDALLRRAKVVRADVAAPLDLTVRHVVVTFDDASETFAVNALPELQKRNIPCTIFAISGLLGQRVSWGVYSDRIMSADELRNLNRDLVTIGSHTVSHPMLTALTESAARMELRESKAQLEKLLQRKVVLFSFPFGAFNDELVELCRDAGYERAFTTLPFSAFETRAQFVCGRVRVDPTDWPLEFCLKVAGAYRWLPLALTIKRKLRLALRLEVLPQAEVETAADPDHSWERK
jgi:peptidoglycan/xylan/chitin deacetylase (PgdA/CDA1 family)